MSASTGAMALVGIVESLLTAQLSESFNFAEKIQSVNIYLCMKLMKNRL